MKLFSIGNIRHLESISTVIPFDFRPKDHEKTSNISYFVSHASPIYMEGDVSILTVNPRIKHFDDVPKRFDVEISPEDTISLQLTLEDDILAFFRDELLRRVFHLEISSKNGSLTIRSLPKKVLFC